MEELRLEIKENAERIDKLCNLLKQNNTKLRTLKQMNTNEAVENKLQPRNWKVETMSANYPMLEVIDENTVKIEGVEYKKVSKEPPLTIYEFLIQCEYGELNPPYIDKKIEIETNAENFLNYLYECCDILEEDDNKIIVSISKQQMVIPND